MNTSVQNLTILAPNAEIVDDTNGQILSRAVARILAKGLQVQGVYGGNWAGSQVGGTIRSRSFEIDITLAADDAELADVIGQVVVTETDLRTTRAVRGNIASGAARKVTIGFTNEAVRTALGWRE